MSGIDKGGKCSLFAKRCDRVSRLPASLAAPSRIGIAGRNRQEQDDTMSRCRQHTALRIGLDE